MILKEPDVVKPMNKQQFLDLIQSLPDNLEVEPIELSETQQKTIGDPKFIGFGGSIFAAEYDQEYINTITVTFNFRSKLRYEYERDFYGNPQTANARNIP